MGYNRLMNEFPSTIQKGNRLNREAAYYEAHQEKLLEQYPEQWIAILEQKVIGVAQDPRQLLIDLKNQRVSLRQVLIKHLTHEEEVWVLIV